VAIIECLVKTGNRGAAVVEYERLRELLQRELDVEPLPETEEAVGRLLGRRPGPRNQKKSRPEPDADEEDEAFAQVGLKARTGDSRP
jgi:DNA-binding SARP family transcriptional activator